METRVLLLHLELPVSCWRRTRLLASNTLRDQTKTSVFNTWTAATTSRISMLARIMAEG